MKNFFFYFIIFLSSIKKNKKKIYKKYFSQKMALFFIGFKNGFAWKK